MLPYPASQCGFVEVACGEGEQGRDALQIIGDQVVSVQGEKEFDANKSSALVAIDKWRVSGNAIAIGGGALGDTRITIGGQVQRTSQSGFQPSFVAYAR